MAIVALLLSGITAPALWRAIPRTPTLDEIHALARAGQFNRAQALLDGYLEAHPGNIRAHLLMAQLTTESTNSHPEFALEHLRAFRPVSVKQSALVKFLEGKAFYHQGRYDLAELSWTEALCLDPIVPEAGWALLDLLDKEGRTEEAHGLGIRLHEVEPDPRDRVKILLEMSRLDIETPDPLSQVELFEQLVTQQTESQPLRLMFGLALIRVNRSAEGLQILHAVLDRNSDSPDAWDAWLSGLYHASEIDKLVKEFARLPKDLLADPRFAKHEGMIAQLTECWSAAVRAYRRALTFEPYNWGVCSRFRFVLRQAGETSELERVDRIYAVYRLAYKQMRGSYYERFRPGETSGFPEEDFTQQRGAYYETLSIKTLGLVPHPDLYHRLADLREKMGRLDEARAWHRLVLRDSPDNSLSVAALERLK